MAGYADMKRTIVGRSARLATLPEPPMNGLIDLLRRHLVSDAPPLTRAERWRSTIAGFLGLLLFEGVLFVLPLAPDEKRLLAPIGATSIIVFMLPHSPLAQPWSIIGGLMLSAPLGYACGSLAAGRPVGEWPSHWPHRSG
jgi:CBS domain-containing membrane protein